MGIGRTEEFRSEAVRIALTSGLSHKQVCRRSWHWPVYIRQVRLPLISTRELLSGPHNDNRRRNSARLCKENRTLRESGTF